VAAGSELSKLKDAVEAALEAHGYDKQQEGLILGLHERQVWLCVWRGRGGAQASGCLCAALCSPGPHTAPYSASPAFAAATAAATAATATATAAVVTTASATAAAPAAAAATRTAPQVRVVGGAEELTQGDWAWFRDLNSKLQDQSHLMALHNRWTAVRVPATAAKVGMPGLLWCNWAVVVQLGSHSGDWL
jgi:hypothetical protein